MKTALITGITGQDGAYLTQLLLSEGYRVYGTYRPGNPPNTWRLKCLGVLDSPQLRLIECNLANLTSCCELIKETQPGELYNLAAQSYVGQSFKDPFTTAQANGVAVLNLLESVRTVKPDVRFYQASSSELFGQPVNVPQTENTSFHPCSPYAVAKLFAHWSTVNYREAYGIFGVCGILYNHESPLRSRGFVSRKITHTVARIASGLDETLVLGNLAVSRDWGYAKEYVNGMYLMLHHDVPDTFILATSRSATVRQFADLAFQVAGIDLIWEGDGLDTQAIDRKTGALRVHVSKDLYRPCDVGVMQGNSGKAHKTLGWATETTVEKLCQLMVEEDIHRVRSGFGH